MIKVGVIGAGHLGKIHLNILSTSNFNLIGFYDTDVSNSEKLASEKGYQFFKNIDSLIDSIDAAVIVSPTITHFEIAKKCIENGKHIFIEKPLTTNSKEARIINKLAKEKNIIGQVGFVERYNQAFISCREFIDTPKFIESHRLSDFNPRGTDVSVIMDLMIHDIDIILNINKSKVKKIDASGVSIISSTPDIANARIEFENGCIANLTSSRISLKKMRKIRVFQKDAYISINFLEKDFQVVKIRDKNTDDNENSLVIKNNLGEEKVIFFENPDINEINSIEAELNDFFDSIENKSESKVSLNDGLMALEVAEEIMSQL
ncbi:MAG: Gfo/Idh/MocA family oxidoreductase [Cryomorphaceae bacterium]|jgi:predicted dehydrogenase|nr:Gfo/Idh/MocA family oxidoreductase [Cryomorphaceae bacterium]MBT3688511.1 Gfo/Idh/MocA family oxidoreductase [Cryomorphaceae bacterium]MBT4221993.1 Gfo/Idh/MocA family oxidoreductase [Cryomorphaceae bacterium]MBT4293995.1 Gfo/Idh/MocA family oxidoreductase [Cryomorphaceae bacterium]MBT4517561.1 Gfo/Idh/MocA family oxidoreductase [Cryomorphaceae bacterium]|tara:strand:+ start:6504 stop:7460 length:957 start_codon:yes stop_codon:yes gene_type:complete